MKRIEKNTEQKAQTIKEFFSDCGCITCQDCRGGSSDAVALAQEADFRHFSNMGSPYNPDP